MRGRHQTYKTKSRFVTPKPIKMTALSGRSFIVFAFRIVMLLYFINNFMIAESTPIGGEFNL